jgi:hypothetical protein
MFQLLPSDKKYGALALCGAAVDGAGGDGSWEVLLLHQLDRRHRHAQHMSWLLSLTTMRIYKLCGAI